MKHGRRRALPTHVSKFEKPKGSGKFVLRWRKKGRPTYYFKSRAGTPEFWTEYDACERGTAVPAVEPGAKRYRAGTIAHTVLLWYQTPEFQNAAPLTKKTYRNTLTRFCEVHGDKPVAALETRHIVALLGAMSDRKAAANKLLDRLRSLMDFAVLMRLRKDNPTLGVKPYRLATDGFKTWSEADIATFRAKHPKGTRARLAFELLLNTGQRRSDVVRMGWQHVRDGRIEIHQQKTNTLVSIHIRDELRAVLDETPQDNLTFVLTTHGAPYTAAGFGNWFREVCDEAGLVGRSAHGLRKAMGRRLASAGRTGPEIQAVLGHMNIRETSIYTRDADRRFLADDALTGLDAGKKRRTKVATSPKKRSQRHA